MSGYMPRGPNVAIKLCIVSSAKQDLSYFCMWARCPFFNALPVFGAKWQIHAWNTRALPFTVAKLSSV